MIGQVLTHVWQSTLFAVAAGLLTLAFRHNRAGIRFWLWLSASLKFFVPFALLMTLGGHLGQSPAAHRMTTPAVAFAVEYVAQPFVVSTQLAPPGLPARDWMPLIITGLWALGCLAIVLMRMRSWLRVREAVRAAAPLDIPAPVGIRSSHTLLEPGVVGWMNPVLLLPEGIAERLTSSELEAVLAHEICHVRRRDNLFASIHMAVEAIFWFHPLVWWIGARLVEERERACDEEVLSRGSQPRIYADAILNVCRFYVESPLECVAGVTGSDIKRRIEAIMENGRRYSLNRAKKALLATAGFAAIAGPIAVGIVIGLGHAPAIHAQSMVPIAPPLAIAAPVVAQNLSSPASMQQAVAPKADAANRPLTALLFDFTAMTSDEQSRAEAAGIALVLSHAGDQICIMVADGSNATVAQDFTDNAPVLQSAIEKLNRPASGPAVVGYGAWVGNIISAAGILSSLPGKKALVYYSSGFNHEPVTGADQVALRNAINAAMQANMALFPIDTQSSLAPAGGKATVSPAPPAGVSQEEYNRRVAYAQSKFGSENSARNRAYIRYGAPDAIEDRNTNGKEIWRYNYLANFHSSAEFEFSQGRGGRGQERININYPPPLATFSGKPSTDNLLAQALSEEDLARGRVPSTGAIAALPDRHGSFGVYPAGEASKLSIPLDSMTGEVDILGRVRTRVTSGGNSSGLQEKDVVAVRDSITLQGPSSSAMYQTEFVLGSGSYVCKILVREQATGRMFGETIDFDVP